MPIGLIGLGVMGRNLALNWRDKDIPVIATDSWESARAWRANGVTIIDDLPSFVAALPTPRVILLMVKAGAQVDKEIDALAPLLAQGDMIIDGGNSNYRDTDRRAQTLVERGIGFLGVGISGGAEGARHGGALMVGGSAQNWQTAQPMLTAVAATAHDGALCVDRFGDGGAGHFVKMVHNGIEYAIMQALAECHALLTHGAGLSAPEVASIFNNWNTNGKASGFLLEITAEITATMEGDSPLVSRIADIAGQKGTGGWTVEAGIAHGVAIPSIMQAITARQISGEGAARAAMAHVTPPRGTLASSLAAPLETALHATMMVSLCQGVHLYARAAAEHGWSTDLPAVLRVWRAGSILRMAMLDDLAHALETQSHPTPLPLEIPELAEQLSAYLPDWRTVVAQASLAGHPIPVLSASLAYAEMLGVEALPTAMVQAQRDRFGAHGFARTDKPGQHHGPWVHPDAETET